VLAHSRWPLPNGAGSSVNSTPRVLEATRCTTRTTLTRTPKMKVVTLFGLQFCGCCTVTLPMYALPSCCIIWITPCNCRNTYQIHMCIKRNNSNTLQYLLWSYWSRLHQNPFGHHCKCLCPQSGTAGSKVVPPALCVTEAVAKPYADSKHLAVDGTVHTAVHQLLALQEYVGTVLATPHLHHLRHSPQTVAQTPSLL